MTYKCQILHDRRTDKYNLGMVMYSDSDCTEWFGLQVGELIDKDIIDAMQEPIHEYTSTPEEEGE